MRIIISPAKKMNVDIDSLPYKTLPSFLEETTLIMKTLQNMTDKELQNLWKCNDSIAKLNIERLRSMDLKNNLTPAILSYEGIQYKYMAPGVFEYGHLDFIESHLRILSGFYGILKPFDGVVPYRLEMQAKLKIGEHKNLYDFWGNKLCKQITAETDFILNLASKEYSKIISAHLPQNTKFSTCVFGELINGKIIEKGTICKMARGQMVRWLAENNIENPQDIKNFSDLGYSFSKEYSNTDNYVFIKNSSHKTV